MLKAFAFQETKSILKLFREHYIAPLTKSNCDPTVGNEYLITVF